MVYFSEVCDNICKLKRLVKGRDDMHKIALILDLPEGKLPGFYAQIVKGLAQCVNLFDRDKEMLVLNTIEERTAVLELLEHYHVPSEEMNLLLLPPNSLLYDLFTDYGFTSRAERHYLYDHLINLFRFVDISNTFSEPKQAFLQMKEHLIAQFPSNDTIYYAVDRQFIELIENIARAYHCTVAFEIPTEI
jgi:hypothetical protein